MNASVALVEAYLQVNGYFTVAEYPVLEVVRHGGTRTATDLDILAFRFPMAGCEVDRGRRRALGPLAFEPDPSLGVTTETGDMIVGEVKEGSARFNPAAHDPLVLEAALVRFGCCAPETASAVVKKLLHKGTATTSSGHTARMIAFGSSGDGTGWHKVITIGHVVQFLREHLRRYWGHLGRTQLSQPALAFLSLMEKSEQRAPRVPEET